MRNIDIFGAVSDAAIAKAIDYIGNFFEEGRDSMVAFFGEMAYDTWVEMSKNASAWGERYASTLKIETGNGMVRVYLDDKHPNAMFAFMVEDGVKPWSIRDALLAGPKATRNLAMYGTRFVTVPLRKRTPTGKDSGKRTSSFSGNIPTDVYTKVKSGVTINEGSLAGLTRYGDSQHGQFFTFRTVSEKTPQGAWQHPGKAPSPVYDDVVKAVEKMIGAAIENMLEDLARDTERHA